MNKELSIRRADDTSALLNFKCGIKAMDDFMHSVNNEELINEWLTYGVPDEASKDDYYSIAEDDESYKECIKIFKRVVKDDECYY